MDYYALLYNPTLTPIAIAATATIAALVALFRTRHRIVAMLGQARQRCFTRSGFFWTVNIVFMGVSVLQAGAFFGIAGEGVKQLLGFAVSFFLDLVTVILMQAMLESRYRGEDGRARQFLFFITVCCGTSTFANLAISLNDFDAPRMLPHAPFWVQAAAPYVLASFPLFVIMMSIAAEMIVNLRPLESLDEEEYEADEKKRVRILQIRNTYLEKQATEELRALTIRATMKANKAAHKPVLTLPFTKAKKTDIDAAITSASEQLRAHYNEQIAALQRQLNDALTTDDTPVSDVFKRPIILDNHRYKEAHTTDGTSAITLVSEEVKDDINSFVSPAINATQSTLGEASQDCDNEGKSEVITSVSVGLKWQEQGLKSVSIDDIVAATGLPKQRLGRAKKHFAKTPQNANLYRISSVIKWLETAL